MLVQNLDPALMLVQGAGQAVAGALGRVSLRLGPAVLEGDQRRGAGGGVVFRRRDTDAVFMFVQGGAKR